MILDGAVVTGGNGFLGWHLACRIRALDGVPVRRWGRAELQAPDVAERLGDAAVVFHLAGVNRAVDDDEVERGNVRAAQQLSDAIKRRGTPVRVVYANSIQADGNSAYGHGKQAAADIVAEAVGAVGGRLVDVRLPNLFGEHGRPRYNSFVATFADAVARGEQTTVVEDREVPLLHAQEAAECLRRAAVDHTVGCVVRPAGRPLLVTHVLARLRAFQNLYAERGELPDLSDPFDTSLFNTYRSYLFPRAFPMHPVVHADPRGRLFETSRSHGGTGQSFVSTTEPGAARGDHYHLTKVERFFVVSGSARISLRRLLSDDVASFDLSGDRPGFVDMPTLWTHNITNVGREPLVTMFWADQLLDPDNPDQFPESVEVGSP